MASEIGSAGITAAYNSNDEILRLEAVNADLSNALLDSQERLSIASAQLADARRQLTATTTDLAAATVLVGELRARVAELEALLPVPEPVTLIGSNLANPIPADADLQITRIFFSPGAFGPTKPQPTWDNKTTIQAAYTLGCKTFLISIKDHLYPDRVGAFLDTAPDDVTILFSYFHEHEGNISSGDFTAAQYRERFDLACAPARARGIDTGPIHNGMTLVDGKWVWGQAWVEPDLTKCQFWATDCYDTNSKGVTIFDAWLEQAKPLGLPILIGEVAQPQGPTQAQFAADMRAWCIANGIAGVCWWHEQFTGKPNYVMSADTQAAWFGLN